MFSDWRKYNNKHSRHVNNRPNTAYNIMFNDNAAVCIFEIKTSFNNQPYFAITFDKVYFKNFEHLFGKEGLQKILEYNSLDEAKVFCDEILDRFQKLKVLL